MTELALRGPDGANPLGFLCALGALRTLALAWPDRDIRLACRQDRANWLPVLRVDSGFADTKAAEEGVVRALDAKLKEMKDHPAFYFNDPAGNRWTTTEVPVAEYRRFSQGAARLASNDGRWAEFAAAFACDQVENDKDNVADSGFRMLGGGQQRFVSTLQNLVERTSAAHLNDALFDEWHYRDIGDGNRYLRFDPADDRRHAMRWNDPTTETVQLVDGKPRKAKIWTMLGANRLAIEALPLFPVFPAGGRARTTGFSGRRKDDTYWTWPLWEGWLSVEVVRAVVAMPELQEGILDWASLPKRGVTAAYRTRKIVVGRYKNFSSSTAV